MSSMTSAQTSTRRGGSVLVAGIVATLAAILGNVAVFYLAALIQGGPLLGPDPTGAAALAPVPLPVPVVLTAIGIIGATIVFALIKRFSRQPARLFLIVALVVLLLSYLPLLTPIGLPPATIAAFAVMHVVPAAIAVPILIRMGS